MNNKIDATIEITLKTKNKFEIDKKTNKIRLDRVLYSAMNYPAEYGYIENTLSKDGDPLDILVITSEPTFPGCIVPTRVIGYLELIDNGFQDYKLISVVDVDPRYDEINELNDLSSFTLAEIRDFFKNYKKLQGIEVIVKEYHNKEKALELIEESKERYKQAQKYENINIVAMKIKMLNSDDLVKGLCNIKFNNDYEMKDIKIIDNGKLCKVCLETEMFGSIIFDHELINTIEKTILDEYKKIKQKN